MKKILLVLVAIISFSVASFAQTAKPKEEAKTPTLTEHQTDKLTIAIKDYQLAQMTATQAQAYVTASQQAVLAAVEKVKKELGLDDSWDFNFQTLTFFKKPAAKK